MAEEKLNNSKDIELLLCSASVGLEDHNVHDTEIQILIFKIFG